MVTSPHQSDIKPHFMGGLKCYVVNSETFKLSTALSTHPMTLLTNLLKVEGQGHKAVSCIHQSDTKIQALG